jgi:hypothetical protein
MVYILWAWFCKFHHTMFFSLFLSKYVQSRNHPDHQAHQTIVPVTAAVIMVMIDTE